MRGNQRQSEAIRGNLYWSDFGRQFGMAALYVMPVYPLLVVSGSAVLFLSTSVLTVVGIGLEQVRWFVNLMSTSGRFMRHSSACTYGCIKRCQALLPMAWLG